ncbi:MAG: hypothetical protein ABIO36_07010 [Pyrinomonadaceae bacterium]
MKKQLSEKQLDDLMISLINHVSADDSMVNEIADSPTTWWGVQRSISRQKEAARSPWPPVGKLWRWLMIGVPAFAAAAVLVSFFVLRPSENATQQADYTPQPIHNEILDPTNIETADNQPFASINPERKHKWSNLGIGNEARAKFVAVANRTLALKAPSGQMAKNKITEIKSDFIALSYARNPDSGQIIRVRVPSSMMVTLGLVSTVEKPSAFVNAEVFVGDDGLTRSIRFVR